MSSKSTVLGRATRGLAIYLAFPFTLHKAGNVKLHISPPCGVPRVRGSCEPSARCNGATSHRSM